MKRATILFLILTMAMGASAQSILYVKPGGQGDGQSWQTALGDLQQALRQAKPGQQIWVAAGEYLPTYTNDRTASFLIPDGVALYGGFSGTERSIAERSIQSNPTLLSGHIGSPSIEDNSFTIVRTVGVSPNTIVDGFIITGGNADQRLSLGREESCGGAWFNEGSNGRKSSPTVRNCVFEGNIAQYGGAIYNNGERGNCRMTIEHSTFKNNIAVNNGGAIYNNGMHGNCNPVINSCIFERNEAPYGASIQNRADGGIASPMLRKCAFRENVAHFTGSSIYNYRSAQAICHPVLSECTFTGNKDALGSTVSKPVGANMSGTRGPAAVTMRPTY